jgi:GNAT superfamily N-acetyltransferase
MTSVRCKAPVRAVSNVSTAVEPRPAAENEPGCRFTVTGYAGHEEEILVLRNANRSNEQKSRAYLDWRYRLSDGAPQPCVFWVHTPDGVPIGMAALIFRRYWIDARPGFVAVLGDISLDASLRGKGVGRELLRHVSDHLQHNFADCLGLVIPTEAARKSLMAVGWKSAGTLRSFVFLIEPAQQLRRVLRVNALAAPFGWLYRKFVFTLLRRHVEAGRSLQLIAEPGADVDALAQHFATQGSIVRDRGREALTWRYCEHPNHRFQFAKLVQHPDLVLGYGIFRLTEEETTCEIYDLIVPRQEDLACMIALLVTHCDRLGSVSTIRLLLNDQNLLRRGLWKLGFMPRETQGVFQVYGPARPAATLASAWAISAGDKDI